MPNKRDKRKRQLKIWVDDETLFKFKKIADTLGMTVTSILLGYIFDQTKNVKLTPNEKQLIDSERKTRHNS